LENTLPGEGKYQPMSFEGKNMKGGKCKRKRMKGERKRKKGERKREDVK
jgi:hypothetical protein